MIKLMEYLKQEQKYISEKIIRQTQEEEQFKNIKSHKGHSDWKVKSICQVQTLIIHLCPRKGNYLLSLLFCPCSVYSRQKAISSVWHSFPFHSGSFWNTSSFLKTTLFFQANFLFCSELTAISPLLQTFANIHLCLQILTYKILTYKMVMLFYFIFILLHC